MQMILDYRLQAAKIGAAQDGARKPQQTPWGLGFRLFDDATIGLIRLVQDTSSFNTYSFSFLKMSIS